MKPPYLLCIVLLCGLAATLADAKTPPPPFTGESVYVVQAENQYGVLEGEIKRLQEGSPQTYYVVIVASTGSGQWATRDYIDDLYQRWRQDAARKKLELDPERSVLIVLAEQERQISLHFGTQLQSKYGLVASVINRKLVDPFFLPHARNGDYAAGLKSLLAGTEQWIRDREAEEQSQRAAAERRAAEIQQNAQAGLAAARRIQEETLGELADVRQTGLLVDAYRQRIEAEQKELGQAEDTASRDPVAALQQARQIQQRLQAELDQLRGLPALQAQAESQSSRLEQDLQRFQLSLDNDGRDGLAVATLLADCTAMSDRLADARLLLKTDPRASLAAVKRVSGDLQAARRSHGQLPILRGEVQTALRRATELRDALAGDLERAALSGTGVADLQDQLARWDQEIATAGEQAKVDYQAAKGKLETTESQMLEGRQAVEQRRADHLLLTRTVPIGLLATLTVLATVALLLRFWWYRRRRRAVVESFELFKSYAVGVLDRMEMLKRRHKMLPFSDMDYSEQLSGHTLEYYDEFDRVVEQLRRQWLSLMETREQVELQLQTAGVFRIGPFHEAESQLDSLDKHTVEETCEQCDRHLDQLEQAHEAARDAVQVCEQSVQLLHAKIDNVRGHELATLPYEFRTREFQEVLKSVEPMLVSDPLGVHQSLQELRDSQGDLAQLCDTVLAHAEGARQLELRLTDTTERTARCRENGLLLNEENACPDPLLEAGRQKHHAVREALNRGQVDTAADHLQQAKRFVDQAIAVIDRQVEAREVCREQIPESSREAARLEQLLVRGNQEREQMAREFAKESWGDVRDHGEQAAAVLKNVVALQLLAETEAAEDVQHYLRASEVLQEIQLNLQHAALLLDQLHLRLEGLVEMRGECRRQTRQLEQRADEVGAWIAEHESLVGAQARQLLLAATGLHERAAALMQVECPDWPPLSHCVAEATAGFDTAWEQAKADVRCHGQFIGRLESVRKKTEIVSRFLQANTADRPTANRRFQAAQEDLRTLFEGPVHESKDWQQLLAQLDEIELDLNKAEKHAKQDIRLSQQAAAEIREAEGEIRRAASFYGQGITADVSAAKRQLDEARRQFLAQDYERCARSANQAERSARQARTEAEGRAQARRRARQALHGRNAAAGTTLGISAPPASRQPSRSRRSRSNSSSSSRNWSSGSSQQSW